MQYIIIIEYIHPTLKSRCNIYRNDRIYKDAIYSDDGIYTSILCINISLYGYIPEIEYI